jgi:4-amino-4-deoxy-L-arabinose transferase-like glycosyltransferase
MREQQRIDFYLLMSIFTLALVVRMIWALLAEILDPFLIENPLLGDAASYHRLAMNLLAGNGYTQNPPIPSAFWPPLYPFTLAGIIALFGTQLVTARIIQAIWGAIPPVVLAWIALKNLGRKEAWLVGFGLAFYPFLIYFGTWLIADGLFILLLAMVFFSAAKFHLSGSIRWLVLMGIFLGLATLAKPTALFYAPLLALWVMLSPQGVRIKKRIGYAFALTLATLVIVLPWTLRNYLAFDQFVLVSTNGGYTFLGVNNPNAWGGHNEFYPPSIPGLNDAEMEDAFYAEAWQWIRANPGDFIRLGGIKFARLLSPLTVGSQPQDYPLPGAPVVYIVYRVFLIVSLGGMILGLKKLRAIGYLYIPVIGVLLSTFIYYGHTRFTLPMAPSLVVFSALAIVAGYQWVREKLQSKRTPA